MRNTCFSKAPKESYPDPLPGGKLSSACLRELMVYIQVLLRDRDANKSMQSVIKSKCLGLLCHFLSESLKDRELQNLEFWPIKPEHWKNN